MIVAPKPRGLVRRSARPPLGAAIVCDDVRMTVQAGMSDELWIWLMERGWRDPNFHPDRRRYRDIPARWVTTLVDAVPEEREAILANAIARAVHRTTLPRTTAKRR